MIRSMTGYGQGTAERPGFRVAVELRTVNNRFADLRFRLPPELADAEREIRSRIRQTVKRGRVELTINLERTPGEGPQNALNRTLLEQMLAARKALKDEFEIDGSLDLAAVLAIPGMLKSDSTELAWQADERAALTEALDRALEGLDTDRGREGKNLQAEIVGRIAAMVGLAGSIRKRAEQMPGQTRDRLIERLGSVAGEIQLDPARVAQEAVLLAERADVTEEIVRLEGHLEQAGKLLRDVDREPVGKRMEFLLQEIHRETNTVAAKSPDLELSQSALALKLEAEKVREQILNLE